MSIKVKKILELLSEEYPNAACALDYDSVFHLAVAVVLSAQTTDVSVNKVTPELFKKYPSPKKLASADQEEVENVIKKIGLYKNKSKNIIALSKELNERYGGEVPGKFEELITLPGVGRKTANVILSEAFGEERIAVDTHVFRVANRIGLADSDDVNKTEKMLMDILPKNSWTKAHHLLIFHGRECCHARKPECERCVIKAHCRYHKSIGAK